MISPMALGETNRYWMGTARDRFEQSKPSDPFARAFDLTFLGNGYRVVHVGTGNTLDIAPFDDITVWGALQTALSRGITNPVRTTVASQERSHA